MAPAQPPRREAVVETVEGPGCHGAGE
jgi:hypothetical protein